MTVSDHVECARELAALRAQVHALNNQLTAVILERDALKALLESQKRATTEPVGCGSWKPKHGTGPFCGNCGFHESEHRDTHPYTRAFSPPPAASGR